MATIHPLRSRQKPDDEIPTATEFHQSITEKTQELVDFAMRCAEQETTFDVFERSLRDLIFDLARIIVALFLASVEGRVRLRTPTRLHIEGREYQRTRKYSRTLTTWFGTVRYERTYMRQVGVKKGRGFFPLDVALGLVADRFSFATLAVVVRLATKLSFAEAKATAEQFLPVVPSTEVVEQATLGFGRFTSEWFEVADAPEGDGDVLVILVDSKGAPTATDRELRRRRKPHKERKKSNCGRRHSFFDCVSVAKRTECREMESEPPRL